MVATATCHPTAPSPWVGALDLAEALVGRGVPFREAHEAVGALVAVGIEPGHLSAADLTAAHAAFEPGDLELLDPARSVERRVSPGGGSFASVRAQLEALGAR